MPQPTGPKGVFIVPGDKTVARKRFPDAAIIRPHHAGAHIVFGTISDAIGHPTTVLMN